MKQCINLFAFSLTPRCIRIALDSAIAQLPHGYRLVFILHEVEGHEHHEIAEMMGCSIGTSKSQLHKARMKLRRILRSKAL